MDKKQLGDPGCPCNDCKYSKPNEIGCMTSVFTGCDVLYDWFYPGRIKDQNVQEKNNTTFHYCRV